jgi:two-component system sensor histidine kinase/response regulator
MTAVLPPTPPNILVVDDTPANLQLLTTMLKERGYKVRPVPSGELALRAIHSSPPDLILLDVTMPGMDGYEVCARIKADAALRDIPILFISALNETSDKVRAFHAGGVDYVTKPFQLEEVEARVRTHLELRRKTAELERSYAQLQQLEKLRQDLTHMVAHDMRSPLLSLRIAVDMIDASAKMVESGNAEISSMARRSVTALVEMVTQMLDVSRMEAGQMELRRADADLAALAGEVIGEFRLLAREKPITLKAEAPVHGRFDTAIVGRVLGNLVGNALKFTKADGGVTVRVIATDKEARVEVEDCGPGIAPEFHRRIFEKYARLESGRQFAGTGLGLAFCKMAIEAHGGAIGVRSEVGQGCVFWFTLPRA